MVKQVIVVRKDLGMRKGKIAAQVAHASLGIFFDRMDLIENRGREGDFYGIILDEDMAEWKTGAFTKIVVGCADERELMEIAHQAFRAGLPFKLITDAGHTEFHGVPTKTCVAIGPANAESIDRITGHLGLL